MHPHQVWGQPQTEGYQKAIQKDLNRLEEWADMNLMKFSKDKYKVLYLE